VTLSEFESKELLRQFNVPFLEECLASDAQTASAFAANYSGPMAVKLCGDNIAHKTERGLVRLGVAPEAVGEVADELLAAGTEEDAVTGVLVAPMAEGIREFIVGIHRDESFGFTIMVGVGGVLAEAIADVAFRLVPISRFDATDMLHSLRSQSLFAPLRGEPAVDHEKFEELLLGLSAAAQSIEGLRSIDLNPVRICNGLPVALDALVEIDR
jgi:acetyl-CoA synthetase (ADP-forming)